jgi:N-methylhydantoinase B
MNTETTAKPSSQELDPVLASVFAKRLKAVGEQMGHALMRSARSVLLSEGTDFSLGIYAPDGTLIEQTENIPILGYASAPAVKQIVEYYGDDVAEGDVIMHNDVFTGGNQMADVKMAKPVFFEGELVAWTVVNAHQMDIGGSVAGGYNPSAREIWQEALRITPVKVFEAGKRRADVWDLIFGNVRVPLVAADCEAVIGACTIGERGIIDVIERYGLDVYRRYSSNLVDVAEQMARAEILSWPDGEYEGEATVTFDGIRPGSLMQIKIKATIAGDSLTLDFDGTDPQTPGYTNAPLATTISCVLIGLYMCMNQEMPHNEGVLRAVDIKVPEGSFLNAKYPAATGYGNHLSDHIVPAVMSALVDVVPDRVCAPWVPILCAIAVHEGEGENPPQVSVIVNPCKGGAGATEGADGFPGIGIVASGGAFRNIDPEMWEINEPYFVHKFEWFPESAGAGQWRGGFGLETELEFIRPVELLSVFGDGEDEGTSAPGLLGGLTGLPNHFELRLPDGERIVPKGKSLTYEIPAGTVLHQRSGGGGGFGDPRKRDPEALAIDVRGGLISPESAVRDYGFDPTADDSGA